MNVKDVKEKLNAAVGFFEKYKFAFIILLAGLVLIMLPVGKDNGESAEPALQAQSADDELEQKLQSTLEHISGAGRVKVLLTVEESRQDILADDVTDSGSKTVTVQTGGGTDTVVVKSLYPVYRGALIVCDGADSSQVKLDIVNAVSSLTGLGSDRITVVKMKTS